MSLISSSAFALTEASKMTNTDINSFPAVNNSGKKVFNSRDLLTLKRLTAGAISPDGKFIVYVQSTPSLKENKFSYDIFLSSVNGKIVKQLTQNAGNNTEPAWSPDGTKIAFVSSRINGVPQIFTMDAMTGSNVQQITTLENGAGNIAWSPNGKYFSFSSDVKMRESVADQYPDLPQADVKLYTELPIRHWSEWTTEFVSHVFYIPSDASGSSVDIQKGEMYDSPVKPFGGAEQIGWSADSKTLTYTCKKSTGIEYVKNTNSNIYSYNLATGKTEDLTGVLHCGYNQEPVYSPDGKYMAFISLEHNGYESDKRRLLIYNLAEKTFTDITKNFNQWVEEKIWSPDSKSMYFTADDSGSVQIFKIDVKTGNYEPLTDSWHNHKSISITKDGKFLSFGMEGMNEPTEYYTMALDSKKIEKVTHVNDEAMSQYIQLNVARRWVTTRDNQKELCWVVYPPNFDKNKKYPMITFLQGGPQSLVGTEFHFRWNYMLMASHGYVLLLPNRRGCPGFGQDWCAAISKDWGGHAMEDLQDATDDMTKESYIEKDKVAGCGASAGGFTAYWMEGHNENKRFKVFFAHCGVFDLQSMYGATEELWFPNWEYGGAYWESKSLKDFYEKTSPSTYADKWATPILIETGMNDFRVPYTQALEAYTVAQSKKIDSKIMIFPQETHFVAKPQNFVIWDSEFFKFLDKYCK